MISLHDAIGSRYLLFASLCECGFEATKASQAVDVLLGPEPTEEPMPEIEPYEPSAEDWASYREWCQELDARWWSDRMDRDEFTYEDEGQMNDADVQIATGAAG
jgi:hypothetical protein